MAFIFNYGGADKCTAGMTRSLNRIKTSRLGEAGCTVDLHRR